MTRISRVHGILRLQGFELWRSDNLPRLAYDSSEEKRPCTATPADF